MERADDASLRVQRVDTTPRAWSTIMNVLCHTDGPDADIAGVEPAPRPARRYEADERQYNWLSSDADDLKNSIIGYLSLSAPFILAVVGLFLVTRS